jgi:hypothetical protein
LALIEQKISLLDTQIEQVESHLAVTKDKGEEGQNLRFHLEHHDYVLLREQLEYRLSLYLNLRKLDLGGNTPLELLIKVDLEIEALGKALNLVRIKRRIYAYVVQALD